MLPTFETKDIWIASALFALGYPCEAEEMSNRKFVFVFDDSEELRTDLNKYNRNELPVDVSTLQSAYKKLKNLTFNQQGNYDRN